jgi:alkyl hydroperoxide reductase subunit AhpC
MRSSWRVLHEFRRRGCDILGISTNSIEAHEQWIDTARARGSLEEFCFPFAGRNSRSVCDVKPVSIRIHGWRCKGAFAVRNAGEFWAGPT